MPSNGVQESLVVDVSVPRNTNKKISKKKKSQVAVVDDDIISSQNRQALAKNPEEMTLEELRASLPLWAKFIANTIEVSFDTISSYISGGILGYGVGGVMNLPLFFKTPHVPGQPFRGIRAVNAKAVSSGSKWGELNAAFSGFHAFARVARGGKEDRFNSIFSSFCTGAYLNRQQGTQAMIRNAATFASFTYMVETFFGFGGNPEEGNLSTSEFDYKEVEME